jgi:hypothetical protein
MLVSFSQGIAFVKTKKTASTSLEASLESTLFDEKPGFYKKLRIYRNGFVAALGQGDFKRKFDVHGANRTNLNQCVSLALRHRLPWQALVRLRDHSSAQELLTAIGNRRYRDFVKVTSVRNPFDLMISLFYWNTRHLAERPSFNDWVLTQRRPKINEALIRSLDPSWKIIRFEHLDSDLDKLYEELGLQPRSLVPKTKSEFRPSETKAYRDYYGATSRAYVEDQWGDWFAHFNYQW